MPTTDCADYNVGLNDAIFDSQYVLDSINVLVTVYVTIDLNKLTCYNAE